MITVSTTFLTALREHKLNGEVVILPMDCAGAALTAQGGWLLSQYHKETGSPYRPNKPTALHTVESLTYNGNLFLLAYVAEATLDKEVTTPSEQAAQIKFIKSVVTRVKDMGYKSCHLATWCTKSSRTNDTTDKRYIRAQDAIYILQYGLAAVPDFNLCLDYSHNYNIDHIAKEYGYEVIDYLGEQEHNFDPVPAVVEDNLEDDTPQWSESTGDWKADLAAIEKQLLVVTPKPPIPNANLPHCSVVDSMLNRHKGINYGWGTTEKG